MIEAELGQEQEGCIIELPGQLQSAWVLHGCLEKPFCLTSMWGLELVPAS